MRSVPSSLAAAPTPRPTIGIKTVAASIPTHLTIDKIGVDAPVSPYTLDQAARAWDYFYNESCAKDGKVIHVCPPNDTSVSWLQKGIPGVGLGGEPGSDSQETWYLYGHTVDAPGSAVFNQLGELSPGDTIVVTTQTGTLVYVVQQLITMPKGDTANIDSVLRQQVAGRGWLITCYHGSGATINQSGSSNDALAVEVQLQPQVKPVNRAF